MLVLVIGVSVWFVVEVAKLHLDHTPRWPPEITPLTAQKLHHVRGHYLHADYHVDVLHSFYSVPHRLIGKKVDIRLTHRMVEVFHNHERVAVHTRRGTRGGHSTVTEHMPKAHQRQGGMTPEYLVMRAGRVGYHVAVLVERLMRERPHPEQGYRSSLGVLSLERRFGKERLEAACDRALTHNTVSYVSVKSILVTGLDKATVEPATGTPAPRHDNIRGAAYYQ